VEDQIKIGDVVKLKSGGVAMAVSEIVGRSVTCQWQDKGKKETETYDVAMLKKFDPDRPTIRIRAI
jgi:uncharacterized protein YodC (DUF2158 family)